MEAQRDANPRDGDELTIALFFAAMSRPPHERDQFIREACASSPDLEAKVRRRVEWEERMNGFLLTPVLQREKMDLPFAPGDTILRGRYHILRLAGEGGMGTVYEAQDEKLGRRVALKCPRFEFRKRLTQEASRSLLINHRNVCRVFEIHTEETPLGDVDLLSMEYLEGETLASRLTHAPSGWLSTREGEQIARQICTGLGAVHAAGVLHRDLKAANIMLCTDPEGPRAVIMDFGIAQQADTFASGIRGTPAYLAPELWKGQSASIPSDIYSLGVLLYEMECGCKPFPDDADWHARLRELPALAVRQKRLRSVLARCLDPDPEKRYSHVPDLEAALWQPSRRASIYAMFVLGAAGIGFSAARERFWPSSPLRLAILPPTIAADAKDATPLVDGFLHDVSYRLKTLRGSRRPLYVHSLAQSSADGIRLPAQAAASLAGTHALSTSVTSDRGRWTISAQLAGMAGGGTAAEWSRTSAEADLAGQLFSLQTQVVEGIISALALRSEKPRQPLAGEAYADYLRGMHYARVDYQDAGKAIPFFERVIQAAPNEALGYAGLAEALLGAQYASGDQSLSGRAQAALAKAEQLDPAQPQVHLMAGRLNAAAGWYERAAADFRRAADFDPSDPQAFIGIGYALFYPGRYQEAEAAFKAAIAAQPGYYKPHLEAGIFYYELRNLGEAERQWLEAVRLYPGHSRAMLNLAVLHLNAGRIAEAETYITRSLAIRRTLPALELLGDLHDAKGDSDRAISSYEEALRTGRPPDYKTWGALAAIYRKTGRPKDAVKCLERGLEQAERGLPYNPRDPDRLAWCAYYHAALGDAARARARAADAAAVANPPAGRVRIRLVLSYDALGDTEAALRAADGAPPALLQEIARHPSLSQRLRNDFLRKFPVHSAVRE